MKFFVNNIEQYSDKSNLVNIEFVDTKTMLDGCKLNIFTPISLQLKQNQINQLPFYICEQIWNARSKWYHSKHLEQQIKQKAPRGQKKKEAAKVYDVFSKLQELNIKEPDAERKIKTIGEHVGTRGDKIIFTGKIISVESSDENSGFTSESFRKYRIIDDDGNLFSYNSYGYFKESNVKLYLDKCWKEKKPISLIANIGYQFSEKTYEGEWNIYRKCTCLYSPREMKF